MTPNPSLKLTRRPNGRFAVFSFASLILVQSRAAYMDSLGGCGGEVDPLSPPWHLCERHSHLIENCQTRMIGMLARVDGALAQLDGLADDCQDTETFTRAGNAREELLKLQAYIEGRLGK